MFHRFINGGQLNNEETSDVKVFIQRRKLQRSYKREYLNLLEQVANSDGGKKRTSIDDDDDDGDGDRLYHLELIIRHNRGDKLLQVEREDLVQFLKSQNINGSFLLEHPIESGPD